MCPRSQAGQCWMPASGRSWPRSEVPECLGWALLEQKSAEISNELFSQACMPTPADSHDSENLHARNTSTHIRLKSLGKAERDRVEIGPISGLWPRIFQRHVLSLSLSIMGTRHFISVDLPVLPGQLLRSSSVVSRRLDTESNTFCPESICSQSKLSGGGGGEEVRDPQGFHILCMYMWLRHGNQK